MVALGTIISTFWILASNSWMQTPQGFEIVNGQVVPVDWFAVIFNPSFPYRLLHMTVAAFLSSALFVGASAAWHLLRGHNTPAIRAMFSMALWMTLIVAPIQAMIGDMHGLNTLKHQPAKLPPSRDTGKTGRGNRRPCCCSAGRIWRRSAPATDLRSRHSAA
jgi:cytochrome d ubiquinol oxidase subunit I